MYVVKIEIHPIREGEVASGVLIEEKRKGESWTRVREIPFITSDASSKRNLALEDDARLIIGGTANVQRKMDPAQRAHVTVEPAQPVQPRRYVPPPHEDEGTNDTGVSLAEQSAAEFEQLKHREALERVRREAEARGREEAARVAAEEAERAKIRIPPRPAIQVHEAGETK